MSRTNYLRPLALLIGAAVAVSVLMVLWSTLPAQAQSESPVNDTGDAPQPTGKHLIAFGATKLPRDYDKRIADLGGTVEAQYPEIGVAVASGLSDAAADSLGSDEDVKVVEPDVEVQWLDQKEEASAEVIAAEDAPAEEVIAAENAPAEVEPAQHPPGSGESNPTAAHAYPSQWHLRAIGADKAWRANPTRLGSPDVTVAILDTGIDGGTNTQGTNAHLDLQGRVDRDRSKSFVPSDDTLVRRAFGPNAPEWTDLHFHGTHVASTVSSNADRAAGVTSRVKLMAVKVFGVNGRGSTSGVLAGIMHAANNKADVINMSLWGKFSKEDFPGFVSVINRAFNHANRMGSAIVVSAGNDNADVTPTDAEYIAYCHSPHVICVSGTGPTSGGANGPWPDIDAKALYSNYGAPITVAAPGGNGGNAGTFVWAACPRTTLITSLVQNPPAGLGCRGSSRVIGLQGTSQSAPHASALAALLVEDIGKGQPSKVTAQLRQSADDLGDLDKDVIYGHGRINVAKALGLEGSTTQ